MGMRPVAEIMLPTSSVSAWTRSSTRWAVPLYVRRQDPCPAVIRFASGGGFSAAGQHSQSMYRVMTAFPGLKVVIPANAYDAKGLCCRR